MTSVEVSMQAVVGFIDGSNSTTSSLQIDEYAVQGSRRVQGASLVGIDVGSGVKMLEDVVMDVGREAVERAVKLITKFTDIAGSVWLRVGDVNGLAGLARTLTCIRTPSYKKSKNHLGLFKVRSKNGRRMKRHSSRVRMYLSTVVGFIEVHPFTLAPIVRVSLKAFAANCKGWRMEGLAAMFQALLGACPLRSRISYTHKRAHSAYLARYMLDTS